MTRAEFRIWYKAVFGHLEGNKKTYGMNSDFLQSIKPTELSCWQLFLPKEAKEKDNMNKLTIRKAKKMLEQTKVPEPCYYTDEIVNQFSFGFCKPAPTPALPNKILHEVREHDSGKLVEYVWKDKQEQGNNPMNYDYNSKTAYASAAITQADPDQLKRDYLEQRLQTTYYTKESDLRNQFGLNDDVAPKTPKELADRIAAGKFVIDGTEYEDEYADGERYFHASEALRWRDPAVKEDHDGYVTAICAMKKFKTSLLDIVKVKDLDAAFDTIKALEDWQPTGKAN